MSNILRTCDCGYADAPLSAAELKRKECPQCGRRLFVENDEPEEREPHERKPTRPRR